MKDRVEIGQAFQVADDNGRTYTVTPYAWMSETAGVWSPHWELLMTEYGGIVEQAGDGTLVVDGTGTLVRRCALNPSTGSVETTID